MRYVKKRIPIEAFQYGVDYMPDWFMDALSANIVRQYYIDPFFERADPFEDCSDYQYVIITTLEGDHRADKGDFIIKGVRGELYPCKEDIFRETYEVWDDNNAK